MSVDPLVSLATRPDELSKAQKRPSAEIAGAAL